MASRLNLARVGAAVLGASAALMVAALPAAADSSAPVTTATVDSHLDEFGGHVTLEKPNPATNSTTAVTGLLGLKGSDGSVIRTYCVQEFIVIADDGNTMTQVSWDQYPSPSNDPAFKNVSGKINWILHNSFPTVPVDTLAKTIGVGSLTEVQAVEGTQAAIWKLSDGDGLDTSAGANDAAVDTLYTYLTSKAVDLPQPPATPTLSVTAPSSTAGQTGGKIGPFTVNTNLDPVSLTSSVPAGVKIDAVDAKGNAVDPNAIVNGTQVYFDVPAGSTAGSGSFKLTSDLQIGQLFAWNAQNTSPPKSAATSRSEAVYHQSLIVAQSTPISTSAQASWTVATTTTTTPAPVAAQSGGQLANTGVSVAGPIALAVVLIGAGVAFLLVQRRRKQRA